MAAAITFVGAENSLPTRAVAVSPSDSVDLANEARELQCTTSGNVSVTHSGDTDGVFVVLPMVAGIGLVGRFKRVGSTNTTATGIVARR